MKLTNIPISWMKGSRKSTIFFLLILLLHPYLKKYIYKGLQSIRNNKILRLIIMYNDNNSCPSKLTVRFYFHCFLFHILISFSGHREDAPPHLCTSYLLDSSNFEVAFLLISIARVDVPLRLTDGVRSLAAQTWVVPATPWPGSSWRTSISCAALWPREPRRGTKMRRRVTWWRWASTWSGGGASCCSAPWTPSSIRYERWWW